MHSNLSLAKLQIETHQARLREGRPARSGPGIAGEDPSAGRLARRVHAVRFARAAVRRLRPRHEPQMPLGTDVTIAGRWSGSV